MVSFRFSFKRKKHWVKQQMYETANVHASAALKVGSVWQWNTASS